MWSMEGLEEEEEEDDDDESVMTSKANAPKLAGSKEQGCTCTFVAEYQIG